MRSVNVIFVFRICCGSQALFMWGARIRFYIFYSAKRFCVVCSSFIFSVKNLENPHMWCETFSIIENIKPTMLEKGNSLEDGYFSPSLLDSPSRAFLDKHLDYKNLVWTLKSRLSRTVSIVLKHVIKIILSHFRFL